MNNNSNNEYDYIQLENIKKELEFELYKESNKIDYNLLLLQEEKKKNNDINNFKDNNNKKVVKRRRINTEGIVVQDNEQKLERENKKTDAGSSTTNIVLGCLSSFDITDDGCGSSCNSIGNFNNNDKSMTTIPITTFIKNNYDDD